MAVRSDSGIRCGIDATMDDTMASTGTRWSVLMLAVDTIEGLSKPRGSHENAYILI